jgi:hypothetical protein
VSGEYDPTTFGPRVHGNEKGGPPGPSPRSRGRCGSERQLSPPGNPRSTDPLAGGLHAGPHETTLSGRYATCKVLIGTTTLFQVMDNERLRTNEDERRWSEFVAWLSPWERVI